MSLLQIAGKSYSWQSGTWESVTAQIPDGRVFRFEEDAWTCRRDAMSCYVEKGDARRLSRIAVALDAGMSARRIDNGPPFDVAIGAWAIKATWVSTWNEWFDRVVTAAAHEYLDMALAISDKPRTLHRRTLAAQAIQEIVQTTINRCLLDFGSLAWGDKGIDSELYEYLKRVRGDIETRLAGAPGSVVQL